jgi:hypothetical protein
VGTDALQAGLQAFGQARENVSLIAEATQNTTARIDQTDDALRITTQAVTQLEATIPSLATATALNSLSATVSVINGEVVAVASSVTDLGVEVGNNAAAISNEAIVRADGDSALAGQISSLSATVDANEAEITNLAATRVDANGAVAAVNQAISATYNSVTALASATAFAEATIDGISSGFVWSLGGGAVLSLVRVDDGVTPPVTTARIRGDYIRLDGNVQVTGDFLAGNAIFAGSAIQSDNFVAGVTGWRLRRSGDGEFNNLLVRGSFTADAVTDREIDTAISAQTVRNVPGFLYETVAQITLVGPRSGRNWTVYAHGEIRRQLAFNSDTGQTEPTSTFFRVQRRTRWSSSDDYLGWTVVFETQSFGGVNDWFDAMHSENIDGRFNRVQYRIQAGAQAVSTTNNQTNVRRVMLTAQIPMI